MLFYLHYLYFTFALYLHPSFHSDIYLWSYTWFFLHFKSCFTFLICLLLICSHCGFEWFQLSSHRLCPFHNHCLYLSDFLLFSSIIFLTYQVWIFNLWLHHTIQVFLTFHYSVCTSMIISVYCFVQIRLFLIHSCLCISSWGNINFILTFHRCTRVIFFFCLSLIVMYG